MKIHEISPITLQPVSDEEVVSLHYRVHQLWSLLFAHSQRESAGGLTREDLVNAHQLLLEEMQRRNIQHDSPLDNATQLNLAQVNLTKRIILVPDFITIVGSTAAQSWKEGHDVDVLIRADRDSQGRFLIWSDNVYLPLRKSLDPDKAGYLHFIVNPQGPHAEHISLYDLALIPVQLDSPSRNVIEGLQVQTQLGQAGLYLVPPHAQWIYEGKKTAIVKSRPFNIQGPQALLSNDIAWGIVELDMPQPINLDEFRARASQHLISETEREQWWPNATTLYFYPVKSFTPFNPPRPVDIPAGVQTFVKDAQLARLAQLTLLGTGAMNSPRRGAALLIEAVGQRVQIDGEKPDDLQSNLNALLVTDPEAWNAKAAVQAGGAVHEFNSPGLYVTPYKVHHTHHDTFGYEIQTAGKRIAYVPEFIEWPEWANGADIALVDGSTWEQDIHFAGDIGGHKALIDVVQVANRHGVNRVIATHIGKTTEQAIVTNQKLPNLELPQDGDRIALAERTSIRPGQRYRVMKPSMAGVTEYFNIQELWDWLSKKIAAGHEILGSPKIDGFRAILSFDGSKLSVWFEDAQESKVPSGLPALPGPAFIIEGEFTAQRRGKWLARTQLAGVLAGKTQATPHFWLYDLLFYDIKDVSDQAFVQRLDLLRKLELPRNYFTVLEQRPIASKSDAEKVGKWAADHDLSEGLYVRQADAPYVFGPTDTSAKLKIVAELKVVVIEILKRENGVTYHVGLRDPSPFTNVIEAKGQKLLDLGNTFVTPDQDVKPGDTLNVVCEELIIGSDDKLFWGKPTTRGPDKSRPAYTVAQAIDLARRGHILKEEIHTSDTQLAVSEDEDTRSERATTFWRNHWQESFPATGHGKFVYQHHWRGLTEKEAEQDEEILLKSAHSVHGDLRMSFGQALFGWTIFLGRTSDVRNGRDLATLPDDDALQCAPKLHQPTAWLTIARDKPYTAGPGSVGSTTQKWSKFFEQDYGHYDIGVWREHALELFMHGKHVQGRYIISYAPVGQGNRVWIIRKPEDQTPIAESHIQDELTAELKSKGQRWLIWAKSGSRPQLIDLEAT